MLVITRQIEEAFRIGKDVNVKILGFNHGPWGVSVRIGIDAPRSIRVERDDIKQRRPPKLNR